jgi:hypothetical protein
VYLDLGVISCRAEAVVDGHAEGIQGGFPPVAPLPAPASGVEAEVMTK